MLIRRRFLAQTATMMAGAALPQAKAQPAAYPSRPIRLVVPYAVGGGSDAFARSVVPRLNDALGQPLIIDNKPGAGTAIGASQVAKTAPDGYTLLQGDTGTFAANTSLYKSLSYDPVKDFAHVTLTARFAVLVVVNPSTPIKSLQDLIQYAKAHPTSYGSPGTGGPHHLAMELLLRRAGVSMQHVPYRGAGPALQDLLAGQIPVTMLDLATAVTQAKAGAVRIIAVGNAQRLASNPEIPTVAEQGFPGYEASAWQGFAFPAGTPRAVVMKMNEAYRQVAKEPAVIKRLNELGAEAIPCSPEEMLAYVRSESSKWAEIIKAAGIVVD